MFLLAKIKAKSVMLGFFFHKYNWRMTNASGNELCWICTKLFIAKWEEKIVAGVMLDFIENVGDWLQSVFYEVEWFAVKWDWKIY